MFLANEYILNYRALSLFCQDGQPSLSEMTGAAVDHLKEDPDGFFLMVESGRIDHAHHDNYARRAMEETVEMERAVQVRV